MPSDVTIERDAFVTFGRARSPEKSAAVRAAMIPPAPVGAVRREQAADAQEETRGRAIWGVVKSLSVLVLSVAAIAFLLG